MSQLTSLGIVSEKGKKEEDMVVPAIFEKVIPDIKTVKYESPSKFMAENWAIFKSMDGLGNSVLGKLFEFLIAVVFIRESLLPVYLNAKVTYVPNVNFDFIFYSKEIGPICISAKTSLRERYKQADLEGIALKNVHRRAKSFLVTTNA